MPTDQPTSYSIPPPPPPRNVFATKIPSTVTFAIGLFLFILPFAELKCTLPDKKQDDLLRLSDMPSYSNTGIGLAFGRDWKLNLPGGGDLFKNEKDTSTQKRVTSQKPNTYAIVALVVAVLGLGLSFVNGPRIAVITTVAGGVAAGALIGLMIDLKEKSKDYISNLQNTDEGTFAKGSVVISLNFTPWFYVATIAMLAAAVFGYMRILKAKRRPI